MILFDWRFRGDATAADHRATHPGDTGTSYDIVPEVAGAGDLVLTSVIFTRRLRLICSTKRALPVPLSFEKLEDRSIDQSQCTGGWNNERLGLYVVAVPRLWTTRVSGTVQERLFMVLSLVLRFFSDMLDDGRCFLQLEATGNRMHMDENEPISGT